jgi:hypothetical protein
MNMGKIELIIGLSILIFGTIANAAGIPARVDTNTENISNNAYDIATNATDIETNTSDISINASVISDNQTRLDALEAANSGGDSGLGAVPVECTTSATFGRVGGLNAYPNGRSFWIPSSMDANSAWSINQVAIYDISGNTQSGFAIIASAPSIGSSSSTRKGVVAVQFSTELEAVQCLNGLLEAGRL